MPIRKKKTEFKLDYIGVKNHDGTNILYHAQGDYSVIFKITNTVPQYSGNKELYRSFHEAFNSIVKILGEGHTIQKLDIFSEKIYDASSNREDFLSKNYDDHFIGRTYNDIETYLVITKNVVRYRFLQYNDREFTNYLQNCLKLKSDLAEKGFSPHMLDEDEIDVLVKRYMAQNFYDKTFSLDNYDVHDDHIAFPDNDLKILSLVDVDEIDFPTSILPYSISNKGREFPEDILSFLHRVPSCKNIVYNQVIEIPDQRKEITALQLKKRRHESMPDPANMVCVEDIDNVMALIQRTNDILVYCHYDVLLFGSKQQITSAKNYLESNLSRIGIIPSKNAHNQLELFISSFPGHTHSLKKYDKFKTTSMPALCLLYKESPMTSDNGTFKLRLTDRQGIPLNIDTADQPWETGRISNRNKFVLGPSGSGKSFLMNSYVKDCYDHDSHIVIIDTGHSYSGLCEVLGGRYVTYEEEKPMTMNPFKIKEIEFNEEKRDFLKSLIGLLWKGSEGSLNTIEDSALSETLLSYYILVFQKKEIAPSFNTFYDFSVKNLKEIKSRENIHIDIETYSYVLKRFYKGGQYQEILNNDADLTLFDEQMIVFEIDNIKDNKILFPITTLIIMDVFLQKMRLIGGRKTLVIEEAWKAIASPSMAGHIKYVYKTVRKFNGEAILVTQELDDIIGNEIVKNSIISNSDTTILLDQSKFQQNFSEIADILTLSEVEQNKIFTINRLDNKDNRPVFKEVYIKRGDTGEVYGVEVSIAQLLTFTTERTQKDAVSQYRKVYGSHQLGIENFIKDYKESGESLDQFCRDVILEKNERVKKIS